jgi:hypothetical protein
MTNDSFFAIACLSIIGLLFGSVLAFGGYRFFLILLPIWGFFFGFGLGAQTIQAIFGSGFLSDVTSWIVGFVVALIFAVLSYLFYIFAVALIAGSLGYVLGIWLMMAIGFDMGFITWMVGIIASIALTIGVLVLNIQKWVIVIATALLGAAVIVGTFLTMFGSLPPQVLVANPVRFVLQTSPFWLFVYLVIAGMGVVAQFLTTQRWQIETYDRYGEVR